MAQTRELIIFVNALFCPSIYRSFEASLSDKMEWWRDAVGSNVKCDRRQNRGPNLVVLSKHSRLSTTREYSRSLMTTRFAG